jgi:hypothetical protein
MALVIASRYRDGSLAWHSDGSLGRDGGSSVGISWRWWWRLGSRVRWWRRFRLARRG